MPFHVLEAMRESRTPDRFVRKHLMPALLRGKWDAKTVATAKWEAGEFHRIDLSAPGRTILPMQLQRTEYFSPDVIEKRATR